MTGASEPQRAGRGLRAAAALPILRHRHARRIGGVLLSGAIVGVVFAFVLPTVARYGTVWHELQRLSLVWVAVLAVATVLNVVTFAFPWMVVIPRLGFTAALQVTQASTALIMVVPGGAPMGMAISYGMLRSHRVDNRAAGLASRVDRASGTS